jgi:hypothetical protein
MVDAFKVHLNYILNTFKNKWLFGISILVWLGGLAGFILIFCQWQTFSKQKRSGFLLLGIFLLGTGISIVKGGAAYSHYLIQLIPFMALGSAVFVDFLLFSRAKWFIVSIISLVLLLSFQPVMNQYKLVVSRALANKQLTSGSAYEIAAYLKQEKNLDNSVYIMSNSHIAYLLIDSMPITKTTVHPSTIEKEYILESIVGYKTTTKQQLANILAQKPKFIVKKKNVWYLTNKKEAKLLLEKTLQNEYKLVKDIQDEAIYRRLP